MKIVFFFLTLSTLTLFSCKNNNTEKITFKNEDGSRVEYFRNKKNAAKEGVLTKFSAEGSKIEEAFYKNDTLDGERRLYFENGGIQTIEHYVKGKFEGKLQSFYQNGKIEIEETYINNAIQGELLHYYDTGEIMERVNMKDNEENGAFTEYYKNGKLKAEGTYRDGDHEDGPLKLYNENGEVYKQMNCAMGLCRTAWVHPDSMKVMN
jgi:antitoxin component YwqK of YwqJK toxin-antitoxin module